MKKIFVIIVLVLLVLHTIAVSALTASEAKQDWRDKKQESKEKQEIHRDAKLDYAADKTEENKQKVIDTGKDVLNAALDEVEAWLIWKDLEIDENPEVPEDLKEEMKDDIDTNLAKIDELRADVDGITTQFELGVVFLKMVGKYIELLTDVARNSGKVWVHIGNEKADTIEEFEAKLRETTDDEEIIELLDDAKDELERARRNIDDAEEVYEEVRLPGTPLLKFSEGNSYLRAARANLINAHGKLNQAYRKITAGGE
ncbi:hypothetical protein KY345_01435 [Candidatus Woesearchaeota archaeon]|nr:hypothetical protein [Candidatus Woesearchaeota archaeon]